MNSNPVEIPPENTTEEEIGRSNDPTRSLIVFTYVAACLMGVGLFAILVYALRDIDSFLSVAMTAILIAAAALVLGAFVGFIFGIPLTPKEAPPTPNEGAGELPAGEAIPAPRQAGADYKPNTTMERISEWLATMLVGIGLTQLLRVPSALDTFGTRLKPALGNTDAAPWVAIGTLLLYVITGFLIGFLWTRIKLPELYAGSDTKQREAALSRKWYEKGKVTGENLMVEKKAQDLKAGGVVKPPQATPSGAVEEADREAKTPPGGVPPDEGGEPPLGLFPGEETTAPPAAPVVLWVDDHPENNESLALVMASEMNIHIQTSLSTNDAIARLKKEPGIRMVISDMGRLGDYRAGINLLKALRKENINTPYMIYSSRKDKALEAEALKAGALATTSSPRELMILVEKVLKS